MPQIHKAIEKDEIFKITHFQVNCFLPKVQIFPVKKLVKMNVVLYCTAFLILVYFKIIKNHKRDFFA